MTPKCPECCSARTTKNGTQPSWKKVGKKRVKRRVQLFRCNACGRQFRERRKEK